MESTIAIIGLFLLIFLRILFIFIRTNAPAKYTICPKCEKKYPRADEGPYICDFCGAHFSVDNKGNADISSHTEIFFGFFGGVVFLLVIFGDIYFSWHLFDVTRRFIFLIFSIVLIIWSIRDYIKHSDKYGSSNK